MGVDPESTSPFPSSKGIYVINLTTPRPLDHRNWLLIVGDCRLLSSDITEIQKHRMPSPVSSPATALLLLFFSRENVICLPEPVNLQASVTASHDLKIACV